jgi:hypothetical protein
VGKNDWKIVVGAFNRPWFKLHVEVAPFAALNLNIVVAKARNETLPASRFFVRLER